MGWSRNVPVVSDGVKRGKIRELLFTSHLIHTDVFDSLSPTIRLSADFSQAGFILQLVSETGT